MVVLTLKIFGFQIPKKWIGQEINVKKGNKQF